MSALAVPRYVAVGLLELLWHFAARYSPRGDVGHWSDERIAAAVSWEGDPGRLITALVASGWLDECRVNRLVVHDWKDHADDAAKKFIARNKLTFVVPERRKSRRVATSPDKSRLVTPAVAVAGAVAVVTAGAIAIAGVSAGDSTPDGAPPPTEPSAEKSWSTEACDLWQHFLGSPPGGRIGKALKPLLARHDWPTVRERWRDALEEAVTWDDPGRFTPEVFARTFDARQRRAQDAESPPGVVHASARKLPLTAKDQQRRAALAAGITGGLKGDGTLPGGDR